MLPVGRLHPEYAREKSSEQKGTALATCAAAALVQGTFPVYQGASPLMSHRFEYNMVILWLQKFLTMEFYKGIIGKWPWEATIL